MATFSVLFEWWHLPGGRKVKSGRSSPLCLTVYHPLANNRSAADVRSPGGSRTQKRYRPWMIGVAGREVCEVQDCVPRREQFLRHS